MFLLACSSVPDVTVTNCPDAGVCNTVDAQPKELDAGPEIKTTMATIFGTKGDKWLGGPAACTGQRIKPHHNAAAHRSLPCGTIIAVRKPGGNIVHTIVVDRGPFWGRLRGEKKNYNAYKHWKRLGEGQVGKILIMRGDLDISPFVAKRIGHTGLEIVEYWVVN